MSDEHKLATFHFEQMAELSRAMESDFATLAADAQIVVRLNERVGESTFLWPDAWLLASIFWAEAAGEQTTLDQVLAYGDAIDHALFMFEELDGGFVRLSAARLLRETDQQFEPDGSAATWYSTFEAERRDPMATIRWIADKLEAESHLHGGVVGRPGGYQSLTRTRYDEAVDRYRVRFQSSLRDLGLDRGA